MSEIIFLWNLAKDGYAPVTQIAMMLFLWKLSSTVKDIRTNDLAHLYTELRDLRSAFTTHLDSLRS